MPETLLCTETELRARPCKGFEINGFKLFVVANDGHYYAYENCCPHQYIPLDWDNDEFLDSAGELILCATHGAQFVIETGECVAGPCIGASLRPLNISLRDGNVFIELNES